MTDASMPTESWRLTIGTIPSYDIGTQEGLSPQVFAALCRECAETVFEETGVYISANLTPARSLYRGEWGCPEGGEPVYMLSAVRNPLFCEKNAYDAALDAFVRLLKRRLKQRTAYLERWPVSFDYYRDEEQA